MEEKLIVVDKEVTIRCPQTGERWITTSIWDHPMVALESYGNGYETKRFEDFDEFFKFCESDGVRNAEPYLNWRKRPTVRINNVTELSTLFLMERNFKWVEIKVEYIPHPEWSMDYLRKSLRAEDFANLCKSRGWKIF